MAVAAMGAVLLGACARSSGSSTAKPTDLYAAAPTISEVKALFGDANWWPGPPSFGVRPLDAGSTPFEVKFSITHRYFHLGTDEQLEVQYRLWDKTASATSRMSTLQSELGSPPTSPKVGDQVLYFARLMSSGGAPYQAGAFVRTGPITTSIVWNRKDGVPALTQLGKIASKMTSRLKDLLAGKFHASTSPIADSQSLPPAELNLTLLGTARIPVEAAVMSIPYVSQESAAQRLHNSGVDDFVFGDYALDRDTHMEVQASVFAFSTTAGALEWLNGLGGASAIDPDGFYFKYDDASGQYFAAFTSSTKGGLLVCRSTTIGEAASRACEAPLARVLLSWKMRLSG